MSLDLPCSVFSNLSLLASLMSRMWPSDLRAVPPGRWSPATTRVLVAPDRCRKPSLMSTPLSPPPLCLAAIATSEGTEASYEAGRRDHAKKADMLRQSRDQTATTRLARQSVRGVEPMSSACSSDCPREQIDVRTFGIQRAARKWHCRGPIWLSAAPFGARCHAASVF